MDDNSIDSSDIPPLDEAFFRRATLRMPRHLVPVTLKLDEEVLDWYRAHGERYEALINAALRIYAEAHRDYQE